MRRLAFHEATGLLGVGDLHPGGVVATSFLLDQMDKQMGVLGARRILEVGAGIGLTTQRMLRRGWRVTAIEPNAVLRSVLGKRLSIRAYPGAFETFDDSDPYDAVIAESVFYRMSLPATFARARRLLRPGGLLAMVDMVWTDAAKADAVAALHKETSRRFGIPMASSEPLTWSAWRRALGEAGFVQVAEQRVSDEPKGLDAGGRLRVLASGLRHPRALVEYLGYRRASRAPWAPSGWLESWTAVWRRQDEPPA